MLTKALELINGTEQNDLMQQGIDKAEEVISDNRDLAKEVAPPQKPEINWEEFKEKYGEDMNDFFHFDEERMTLTGEKSHVKYSIGELVVVKVVRASKEDKTIDFEVVRKVDSDGKEKGKKDSSKEDR